ncbi:MAG: ABC transporter ATP-binding protein [Candidatus Caldarchaeum sp.]|nr:ABC transporter ATP-binding protein [Candidatus Caldarchaeum sp.]
MKMFEALDVEVMRKNFRISVDYLKADGKVVLLGRNGTGKSTLLKCFAGLLKPVRGRLRLDGKDITGLHPREREIGYLPQEPVRIPLSPAKLLRYFAARFGVDDREVVRMFGLEEIVAKTALSQGENQIVNLAVVMMKRPRLLLLDEPTSGMDFVNKIFYWRLLKKLSTPMVYVTHDPVEASMIADHIYLVGGGHVKGPYENPLKDKVEEFLNEYNLYRLFENSMP